MIAIVPSGYPQQPPHLYPGLQHHLTTRSQAPRGIVKTNSANLRRLLSLATCICRLWLRVVSLLGVSAGRWGRKSWERNPGMKAPGLKAVGITCRDSTPLFRATLCKDLMLCMRRTVGSYYVRFGFLGFWQLSLLVRRSFVVVKVLTTRRVIFTLIARG